MMFLLLALAVPAFAFLLMCLTLVSAAFSYRRQTAATELRYRTWGIRDAARY